eukprot:gene2639-1919_t
MPSCDLTWGENPDAMGPFGLDYAYMYECSSSSINPLVVILYFLWIFYLISLLAQTASNYLSPTLSKICEKLNIAYDVAGVTFLAFGNGAPDFFSLIASFSGGVDILVGVGALLGGSMFVCTVVVGSIAILSPCDVSKRIFLRDISFHLMSVIAVSIIALIGRVYLPMVILLYAMYVVYVLMVVVSSSRDAANHAHHLAKQRYLRKKQKTVSVEEMEVQTAFWHVDSTTASKAAAATGAASANSSISIKRSLQSGGSSLSSSYSSSTPFASSVGSTATASSGGGGGGGGGYSFLLLSSAADKAKAQRDDDDDDEDATDPDRSAGDDEAKDGDGAADPFYHRRRITISGGAPLDWDRIVVEHYYAADRPGAYGKGRVMVGEESAGGIASARRPAAPRGAFTIDDDDDGGDEERGGRSRRSDGHSGDDGEGVRLIDFTDRQKSPGRTARAKSSFLAGGEGLEASLLAAADDDDADAADAADSDEEEEISFVSAASPNTAAAAAGGAFGFYDYRRLIPRSDGPNAWKLQTMYGASVLTSMYWQQWTLRRSLRHRFVDDWRRAGSGWEKLWVALEAPASVARDLTIPTLEEAQWSKTVAMLHPVAAPVFALWVLGFFGSSSAASAASSATAATAAHASRRLLATVAERLTTTLSDACPALAAYARRLAAVKLAPQLAAAASALLSSSTAAAASSATAVAAVGAAAPPTMSGFEVFLVVASCAGASLFIFLSTNTSRPPHSWLFAGVWALAAFVMCILWIYALAGELITILSVLGDELRLPPAFLGLTVLAWGNSIGDFFTNTAVAKQGYGTMALAGCYGGPVFNLLIGFGSSLLYATVQTYSDPGATRHYYVVALDASSWVSLGFIVVALASTMAIVILRDYRMDRLFGGYLLALYALYSVVQAILVLVERSR